MNNPWYFAKSDDSNKSLKKIGYTNTKVHLHNDRVILTNRDIYSRFVKTVIMKPFLEHLPDEKVRLRYLELFLDEVEKRSTSSNKRSRLLSATVVLSGILPCVILAPNSILAALSQSMPYHNYNRLPPSSR